MMTLKHQDAQTAVERVHFDDFFAAATAVRDWFGTKETAIANRPKPRRDRHTLAR
jgi:phosphoglycolate phosphatase-like HAD superfamily hydrolase